MAGQVVLTSGNIMGQLLRLSIPLLMGNILQQLYNIINSIVVSAHLGEDALAALGIAESIMNLFLFVISGACLGASVLIARFYGEGDRSKLRQELFIALVLVGGFTLVLIAGGLALLRPILVITQTPADLMEPVSDYLRIIFAGLIFTFGYNFLAAVLRAIGNTRIALVFLFISLGYNLAAAYVLVTKADLGLAGTAVATATAQLLSALLCLIYIAKKVPFLRISRRDMRFDRGLIGQTVSYSAVSALHQSSLYLGKLMVQGAVNGIDPTSNAAIAAFAAATRVENFVQAFGSSGAETIAIFVAQNQGAGQYRRARRGFYGGLAALIAMGMAAGALMILCPRPPLSLFLEAEGGASLAYGASYLTIVGWFYFLSFIGHGFVGYFRGDGRMNIPLCATITQITVRVVGTYLLVGAMGLDAVALATGLGWVVVAAFHVTCFLLERRRDERLHLHQN